MKIMNNIFVCVCFVEHDFVQFDSSINTYCIYMCMWVSYVFIYLVIFFSTEFNASPAVSVSRCDGWSCIVGVGLRCWKMTASSLLKMMASDWHQVGRYCKNQVCVEVFESRCSGMRIIGIENKTHLPRRWHSCFVWIWYGIVYLCVTLMWIINGHMLQLQCKHV